MALIDRLAGIGPNPELVRKLPITYFWANLYELAQGYRTKQQIIDLFALDSDEAGELQWLIDKYNAQATATAKAKFVELVNVVFIMAEARAPGYTTNAQLVARLNAI
jgi:hypothetical protein